MPYGVSRSPPKSWQRITFHYALAREMSSGPRPFRFELMWFEVPGFKDKIRQWWEEIKVEGMVNFVFGQKFKTLKEIISRWKKGLGESKRESRDA